MKLTDYEFVLYCPEICVKIKAEDSPELKKELLDKGLDGLKDYLLSMIV